MSQRSRERRDIFGPNLAPASSRGRRYRWYRLMFHSETSAERNFDIALILAILASVIVVMLDSIGSVKLRWHHILFIAEWAFTLLFTVEYAVRLWAVRRPFRYMASFFGIIDVLAVLPSYLALTTVGSNYLLIIRVLRLLRVFRILKLAEYSSEAGVLVGALLRSRRKILVFVSTVITIVMVFGALMYVVEGPEHGFTSIPVGMYWAIVTMATVGFGDLAPATPLGQFITSILILIGYGIIAVPTGIYTAELASSMLSAKRKEACPQCGLGEHETDARHCRRCGAPLPA